jgi:hypothetical protein
VLAEELMKHIFGIHGIPSNDQNLWMALGLVDVSERTFPRMI